MPAYLLELLETDRGVRKADFLVIHAASAAAAREVAKSRFNEDSSLAWDGATATELAEKPINTSPNMDGWGLRVAILDSDPVIDITVRGDVTDDTLDEIAALMVTALNATSLIAAAAYNAGTNVLTIAETTDGLGDKVTLIEFLPPVATNPGQSPIADLVLSKVDGGASGAALSVTFQADSYALPFIYGDGRDSKV